MPATILDIKLQHATLGLVQRELRTAFEDELNQLENEIEKKNFHPDKNLFHDLITIFHCGITSEQLGNRGYEIVLPSCYTLSDCDKCFSYLRHLDIFQPKKIWSSKNPKVNPRKEFFLTQDDGIKIILAKYLKELGFNTFIRHEWFLKETGEKHKNETDVIGLRDQQKLFIELARGKRRLHHALSKLLLLKLLNQDTDMKLILLLNNGSEAPMVHKVKKVGVDVLSTKKVSNFTKLIDKYFK